MQLLKNSKFIFATFILLCIVSSYYSSKLYINFEFSQFFPKGDDDLIFFEQFTKDFEKDDNTFVVALTNKNGDVFDTSFLAKLHDLTLELRSLPYIRRGQSITTIKYPIKTPFGFTMSSLIDYKDVESLTQSKNQIINDERFKGSLLSKDLKSASIILKTEDDMDIIKSDSFMIGFEKLMERKKINSSDYHALGKVYFQSKLVYNQKREIFISTLISGLLVCLIFWLIYRTFWSIFIGMLGIGGSLLLFLGFLGLTGQELSIMSALYPVLILIASSSDVIHLMTSYIEGLKEGGDADQIMDRVLKEIGKALFFTSATTAVGFATLYTSRIGVIKTFGLNAAIGVMIAYLMVVIVIPPILKSRSLLQLFKPTGQLKYFHKLAMSAHYFSIRKPNKIWIFTLIGFIVCLIGTLMVNTNYKIINTLPKGEKVTADYIFFEKNFSGYRPLELALTIKPPYKADDFEVVKEIDKIEKHLRTLPYISSVYAESILYKSLEMAHHGNQKTYYKMPDSIYTFEGYKALLQKAKNLDANVLTNIDKTKSRISAIITDLGGDSIKLVGQELDRWILDNTRQNLFSVRRTGTGLILDKNTIYITENLLKSIALSLLIISAMMAYLVKNLRMLVISLIPNILPLFFAAALLGYFNIDLEASVSIIFTIVFGIIVDDTIHFLSHFKLCMDNGKNVEEAIETTFKHTGKSMILTSTILFFGFLIMLFSRNPVSVTVGILISFTLVSALICDLYLLPLLLRKFYKK